MRYEIRELGLGEILDQAVTLTKNHFALFIIILLVLQIPFGLIVNGATVMMTPEPPVDATPEEQIEFAKETFTVLGMLSPLVLIYLFLVVPITNAALVHAIAAQYLQKAATVGSSFRRAFKILLPLIGTWILVYLTLLGGLLLCCVPFFIFTIWFALATQVVVIEGTGGIAAMKRSKALVEGNFLNLFVLFLLLAVINMGVGSVAQVIPQKFVQVVLGVLAQSVTAIFGSAALVVFYFSCRCKHENFDLTLLAQSVGEEPPPPETSGGFQG